jgi:hypothetical protein
VLDRAALEVEAHDGCELWICKNVKQWSTLMYYFRIFPVLLWNRRK